MAKQNKPFLPTTRKGWIGLTIVFVLALQPILLVVGMRTGQIGYTFVQGNSMCSVFPWGSLIVILPLRVRNGDYVVAWTWDGMDDAKEIADKRAGFVVKQLRENILVSTDCADRYSCDFKVRSKVIGWLPTQKVLWWMNKGVQNSVPGYKEPTTLDREVASVGTTVASARDEWLKANCRELRLNSAQIVGGHLDGQGVTADKSTMTITFAFHRQETVEEVELNPPGEFWGFAAVPSIGQQVAGSGGRFRPCLRTDKLVITVTGCQSGPAGQSANISSLRVWLK